MIALIIPWRGTDPAREAAFDFVARHLCHVLEPDAVIVADDPHDTFNRGRALNAGVERSGAGPDDVLVFADADLWVPGTALESALTLVDGASYVVPFDRLVALDGPTSVRVIEGRAYPHQLWGDDALEYRWERRSTGGCNVLRRSTFDAVGGFDPRFAGWGGEDGAWDAAVTALVGPASYVHAEAVHLHHAHDATRGTQLTEDAMALARRYDAAAGDTEAIRALLAER